MLVLGLTGSAAMGKSTVAAMFADAGVPVFDADRTVHELYRGKAVGAVEAAFPGTTAEGSVDRDRLRDRVLGDEAAMERLEALVHPMVREERDAFLAEAAAAGARVVLLDIPLLFETGSDGDVHAVIVVTAPPEVQMARLMERAGMTEDRARAMLARQLPDAEKRARAHFIVATDGPLDATRAQVSGVLRAVAGLAAGSA